MVTSRRITAYSRRALHQDDPGWNSFVTSSWLRLTREELEALEAEMVELIARYDRVGRDERPDAEPVLVFARGLHVEP